MIGKISKKYSVPINSNIIHTYIHSPGFCKSLGTFGIDNAIISLNVLCYFSSRKQAIVRIFKVEYTSYKYETLHHIKCMYLQKVCTVQPWSNCTPLSGSIQHLQFRKYNLPYERVCFPSQHCSLWILLIHLDTWLVH